MVNTNQNIISVDEGLLTTVAYKINNQVHYAIEGSIYSCGNIIKWLRDKMKFFENSEDSENFLEKDGNSNNVLFLPAFNGLGAPYWNSEIRGGFYGITQDTSIDDMITATFQSVAFQTKDIINILNLYDIKIQKLLVDGGMVSNKTFCQVLADTLQIDIAKPENAESTAIGACKVAMLSSGMSIENLHKNDIFYEANKNRREVYSRNYSKWQEYLLKTIK